MNNKLVKQFEKLESITDVLSLATSYITEEFIESPLLVAGTEHYLRMGNLSVQNILMQMNDEYHIKISVTDGMAWSDLAYKGIISSDDAAWMTKLESRLKRSETHGINDPKEIYVLACNMIRSFDMIHSSLKGWGERLGNNVQCVG